MSWCISSRKPTPTRNKTRALNHLNNASASKPLSRPRLVFLSRFNLLFLQIVNDFGELSKGGLEIFEDLGGYDVGVERWPRANNGCQLYGGRH